MNGCDKSSNDKSDAKNSEPRINPPPPQYIIYREDSNDKVIRAKALIINKLCNKRDDISWVFVGSCVHHAAGFGSQHSKHVEECDMAQK